MSDLPRQRKRKTAQQMHAAIKAIIERRSVEAAQSPYDRKVCILAVSAAQDAVNRVPVEATATEYCQRVVAVLSALQDSYNDPDGEYTSGKAPIGDIYFDVWRLLDAQHSHELAGDDD
jgi:hypothetical protein